MTRFTPTVRQPPFHRVRGVAAAASLLLVVLLAAACDRGGDVYREPPQLERSLALTADGDTLQPLRLQVHRDTLWVSYRGLPRLDAYDLSLNRLASVPLTDREPVSPSSFAVTDSAFYVCDHARGMVVVYDREGRYRNSFGRLPDGQTELSPLTLTHFGGVLYLADMGIRRVLAISMADAAGITEIGELILAIPEFEKQPLGLPSAVHVTADGRLIVGDAEESSIRVFTCDGRPIYEFDEIPGQDVLSPQAIVMDRLRDPSLQDDSAFDPSGVPGQGRFHVVDSHTGRVHMFNPLGRYIASYPEPGRLERPAGIAIDRAGNRIFVADPPAHRIHIFRTKEA